MVPILPPIKAKKVFKQTFFLGLGGMNQSPNAIPASKPPGVIIKGEWGDIKGN